MEPELAAEALELLQGTESLSSRSRAEITTTTQHEEESPPEDAAWDLAHAASREALTRDFPEALKAGSELAEACREELAYLREAQSPLADDPEAEYKIAKRMARMIGMANRPACGKVAARRSVRPMPTFGAPIESPATALERRMARAKSTGEMLELMREVGTPFEALFKR